MKRAWAVIMIIALLMGTAVAEETYGWVMCQPDSRVNIREKASRKAEIVAIGYMGDKILLDGKKHGKWVHCIIPCETGEGWIREDFLSIDEPEDVGTGVFVVTNNKTFARRSAGGSIRKTLNKGDTVTVYMLTVEWSVTSQGFMKTRYLCEVTNGL